MLLLVNPERLKKVKGTELVFGWGTSKYTTCCQKHRTEYSTLGLKKCELSKVQILLACLT